MSMRHVVVQLECESAEAVQQFLIDCDLRVGDAGQIPGRRYRVDWIGEATDDLP